MAKRNITGFEAAPQGQIGSGFAQVFDTSNLVGAALQMQQMRQQQFDGLIASLADIDPNLARPVDTDGIIRGVNSLQDYVIENYQAISDPRKDPSKAIEFRRRKNELLAVVNTSRQMGEKAIELAKELPKNDFYMGAFDRNRELIESLQSTPALSIGEDGSIVRNNDAVSLFNQRLTVGKGANEFATELANKTKPQFDPNNPNVQQVRLANGTLVMVHPDRVTDQQADMIIDNSLMGGGIDGVAVVNSVLGFEAPYDALSEQEKQVVRDAIRPSFLQRLDTKMTSHVVRDPSNFGGQLREANVDDRLRNLEGFVAGEDGMLEQIVGAKYGQSADVIRDSRSFVDTDGKLTYEIVTTSGGKVSTNKFKVGTAGENGFVTIGSTPQEEREFYKLMTVVNGTLNQTLEGEVRNIDFERIGGQLKDRIQQRINSGQFDIRTSSSDVFQVDGQPATLQDVKTSLDSVIGEVTTSATMTSAANNIHKWSQRNGLGGGDVKVAASAKLGYLELRIGSNIAQYDMNNPEQRQAFIDAYIKRVALPTGSPTGSQTLRARGAQQQAQGVGAKYNP